MKVTIVKKMTNSPGSCAGDKILSLTMSIPFPSFEKLKRVFEHFGVKFITRSKSSVSMGSISLKLPIVDDDDAQMTTDHIFHVPESPLLSLPSPPNALDRKQDFIEAATEVPRQINKPKQKAATKSKEAEESPVIKKKPKAKRPRKSAKLPEQEASQPVPTFWRSHSDDLVPAIAAKLIHPKPKKMVESDDDIDESCMRTPVPTWSRAKGKPSTASCLATKNSAAVSRKKAAKIADLSEESEGDSKELKNPKPVKATRNDPDILVNDSASDTPKPAIVAEKKKGRNLAVYSAKSKRQGATKLAPDTLDDDPTPRANHKQSKQNLSTLFSDREDGMSSGDIAKLPKTKQSNVTAAVRTTKKGNKAPTKTIKAHADIFQSDGSSASEDASRRSSSKKSAPRKAKVAKTVLDDSDDWSEPISRSTAKKAPAKRSAKSGRLANISPPSDQEQSDSKVKRLTRKIHSASESKPIKLDQITTMLGPHSKTAQASLDSDEGDDICGPSSDEALKKTALESSKNVSIDAAGDLSTLARIAVDSPQPKLEDKTPTARSRQKLPPRSTPAHSEPRTTLIARKNAEVVCTPTPLARISGACQLTEAKEDPIIAPDSPKKPPALPPSLEMGTAQIADIRSVRRVSVNIAPKRKVALNAEFSDAEDFKHVSKKLSSATLGAHRGGISHDDFALAKAGNTAVSFIASDRSPAAFYPISTARSDEGPKKWRSVCQSICETDYLEAIVDYLKMVALVLT